MEDGRGERLFQAMEDWRNEIGGRDGGLCSSPRSIYVVMLQFFLYIAETWILLLRARHSFETSG